jgi:hypothetical protein
MHYLRSLKSNQFKLLRISNVNFFKKNPKKRHSSYVQPFSVFEVMVDLQKNLKKNENLQPVAEN